VEAWVMEEALALSESFKRTEYQLAGHGRRNIQVLKAAIDGLDGQTESDLYGKGELIEAFQAKMSKVLGKETAVFFPSGTMAQQIALRIWCDRKGIMKVAYHPLCHLEIHEEDGLKKLHHIESVLLADPDRIVELSDLLNMKEEVACLLLELPQREIGGELPDYETLEAISVFCRDRGIKLHLDGARLFECLPYYGKSAAEICALFDSAYVSFYKGIGGVAGAILAGEGEFIRESAVWKRRHGGDLISLYPYIISADYYFDRRIDNMENYYKQAKDLASSFQACHRVTTRPRLPVSNMFHVHIDAPKEAMEAILCELHRSTGIGFAGRLRDEKGRTCSFELNVGDQYERIPKALLREAFDLLDSKMRSLIG
jgi:threonine aldolase